MYSDGINLLEGSEIVNLSVASGDATVQSGLTPNAGELFYRTDLEELQVYQAGVWEALTVNTTLNTHENDTDVHVTAAQSVLLDNLTVTYADLNNTAPHFVDESLHLTSSQNILLDGIIVTFSDINDVVNKVHTTEKGAANGVAPLDASTKIPQIYLPSTVISETYVVADEPTMLALSADRGDLAIRTDLSQTFILEGSDPAILANWTELLSPTNGVTSINGQFGAVTAADIKLHYESNSDTNAFTDAYKTQLDEVPSTYVHLDGTVPMTGTLQAEINTPKLVLPEIDMVLSAGNIVDSFRCDVTKDSNEQWRFATHTSWYNEARPTGRFIGRYANELTARAFGVDGDWYQRVGTTEFFQLEVGSGETQIYRAGRKEFPKVALIVVETNKVVIYDITDRAPSMWMVFVSSSTTGIIGWASTTTEPTLNDVEMLEGKMVLVGSGQAGLLVFDFVRDDVRLGYGGASNFHLTSGRKIIDRNIVTSYAPNGDGYNIVGTVTNDLSMLVLPDAPIDPVTGLKIPTIAIATSMGMSIINHYDEVINITNSVYPQYDKVSFTTNSGLLASNRSLLGTYPYIEVYNSIPESDVVDNPDFQIHTTSTPIYNRDVGYITELLENVIGTDFGITLLKRNFENDLNSMVAYITKDYNTGWMVGDIRTSLLADTVTGSVSGTVTDHYVKNNTTNIVGTLNRSLMGAGSEAVMFGGFSVPSYIEQPHTSDLDFGSNDFWFGFWIKQSPNSTNETIFMRAAHSGSYTGSGFHGYVNGSGNFRFDLSEDGFITKDSIISLDPIDDGNIHFIECFRMNDQLHMFVDRRQATVPVSLANVNPTTDLSNPAAVLRLGIQVDGTTPAPNASLALFRISATIPSPSQRKHMFETEKSLSHSPCTLAGTSDIITAVDFNEKRHSISAATSWGRSKFHNLVRIDADVSTVGTINSIVSSGDMESIGGTTGSTIFIPEFDLREHIMTVDDRIVDDNEWRNLNLQNGWATDWVNLGSIYHTAQFRKVGDEVQLRGVVTAGNYNDVISVLPIGFRPTRAMYIPTMTSQSGGVEDLSIVEILPNGIIQPKHIDIGTVIDWLTLDNIRFSIT